MSNHSHGWTKEAWLAYKAKAEEWVAYMLGMCGRIAAAISEMESRED